MSVTIVRIGPQGGIDHLLPVIRRTPRELVCLAVGVVAIAAELGQRDNRWLPINLTVAAGGMLLFVSRLFFARYVAIAAATGALACGVYFGGNLWTESFPAH